MRVTDLVGAELDVEQALGERQVARLPSAGMAGTPGRLASGDRGKQNISQGVN